MLPTVTLLLCPLKFDMKNKEEEQIVCFVMFDGLKGIASQIILSKIKSWVKIQK